MGRTPHRVLQRPPEVRLTHPGCYPSLSMSLARVRAHVPRHGAALRRIVHPTNCRIAVPRIYRLEVAMEGPKGLQKTRIKVRRQRPPITIEEDIAGGGMVKGGLIRPLATQRVVLVSQHHDP